LKFIDFHRIESLQRSINAVKDLKSRKSLTSIIRAHNPDIVHSHAFKGGLISRTILGNWKRVHSYHGHHLYDPEFGGFALMALNAIERKLDKNTNGFISVGEKVKNEIQSLGIGKNKSFVSIPPGIDCVELSSREHVERRLKLKGTEGKTFVWMGRFVQVKRPDLFISLAREFPLHRFLMAGDGPLRQKLLHNNPSNLEYLGWQRKEDLFSLADALVITSESEGMPLVAIEAQSCGLPVIATDVGSIAEIVEDSKTGFLSEPNEACLRKQLTRYLDFDGKTELSRNAKDNWQKLFTRRALADSHLSFYREVLDL
jgi:glycosyltransferase involved in cell wall biosynthesis